MIACMKRLLALGYIFPLCLLPAIHGCSSDDDDDDNSGKCDPVAQTGCKDGKVCENVQGAEPACYAPVSIAGKVFDTTSNAGVEGARVVARDANEVAVSGVATTGKDGTYELRVPTTRDKDGKPIKIDYTLRADAAGYVTFPKAPRPALPIDVSTATGEPPRVQNSATDVGLIPLENSSGLGSISGTIKADNPGGTLVVAGGVSATADRNGDYKIFNVPAGSHMVSGYLAGINLGPANADVKAGENAGGVDLEKIGDASATVTGKVEIVAGTGDTSVILVVDDTFVPSVARGEAPPGLRVGGITGDFSIPNVPDGKYAVLAAFENDGLVRDPDPGIAGTDIVKITVAGGNVDIAQGFKVTTAIAITSPTDGEKISGNPTFVFAKVPSAETYDVQVFDVLGKEVWKKPGFVGPKGGSTVSVPFDGNAASTFKAGIFYQYRVTSFDKGGEPNSQSEDLKGLFLYQ